MPYQQAAFEQDLHQGQKPDRAKRPIEKDDHQRAGKLGREHRTRREPAPLVILRCDEDEEGRRDLRGKRELQRPEEGHDQQIGQSEYEKANLFSPV